MIRAAWLAALTLASLVVLAFLAPGTAHAVGAIGALSEAQARLNAGDYYEARELTAPLLEDESLARGDRAEALRLNGLARFFLGDREGAEESLLGFLELEPEAHLDPALVPPLGIAFFEDVRNRHWAQISKFRKKPKRRGYAVVNLVPFGAGQFQNGDRVKGWSLAVSEGLLGATALTTFLVLVANANPDGTSDLPSADAVKSINQASFVLFVVVWGYGAVDGYLGWRQREAELGGSATVQSLAPRGGLGFGLAGGGAQVSWSGSF
jgi:hypothetical protein